MDGGSPHPRASAAGSFALGGDLPVARLGFGALRILGPNGFGPPRERAQALASCGGPWTWALP
jgi:pyridoxine 4-dehydrogenase